MTLDENKYTFIDCPQCGFEGSREISVKDDDIAELLRSKEHWIERWSDACNENQVLLNRINELTMELGDLPEAQMEMMSEIKRLKIALKDEYNKAIDDLVKVFNLTADAEFREISQGLANVIIGLKKV
jgi:hypothetical protein